MGYLSDWNDAERAAQAAHDAHPDCDETGTCPATEHLLTCRRWRHDRRVAQMERGDFGDVRGETDMEMRLRTALAYKARYDKRPTTDPLVLLMRQQNEDEIARLQEEAP